MQKASNALAGLGFEDYANELLSVKDVKKYEESTHNLRVSNDDANEFSFVTQGKIDYDDAVMVKASHEASPNAVFVYNCALVVRSDENKEADKPLKKCAEKILDSRHLKKICSAREFIRTREL